MKAQYKEIEEKMNKTLDALYREFGTIRAGKASPSVLDRVTVDYYGAATPIQQLATISTTDARTLMIQPWDKSTLKLINKAIQASDVGINPTDDGSVIRLVFPAPTEERRKELCKQVSKEGEGAKVSIRNIRRDAVDKFKAQKKANELSEDDLKDAEKDVQELTDKYTKLIEKAVKEKEQEVMSL
ncbi:MAG: ribosome recycling factor [Negativibacillus sp.]|jgi:ribosome recycling factor|nr:ribosome recycling factor [Clostridium sp.]MEE0782473.1 ribosome recycling factor [Negativibacillus sp.]CDA61324.1 ribosome-recycling factor [Clostridium sp. CAG:169]